MTLAVEVAAAGQLEAMEEEASSKSVGDRKCLTGLVGTVLFGGRATIWRTDRGVSDGQDCSREEERSSGTSGEEIQLGLAQAWGA